MKRYSLQDIQHMGLKGNLPRHVAIIMDGNGRWAKQRMLPRTMGHRAGTERLNEIIRFASDLGIEALSLYAFSTENWKRPNDEVSDLFGLLVEYFKKEIDELDANDVCIRALGVQALFPVSVRAVVYEAGKRTAQNKGLKLNIALNYGGQDEILRAAKSLAADAVVGKVNPEEIDGSMLESRLDTAGLPSVDFLIRTGGEQRISNFLLYQAAYAEFLFMDEYWPDFTKEKFLESLRVYTERSRRYGGL